MMAHQERDLLRTVENIMTVQTRLSEGQARIASILQQFEERLKALEGHRDSTASQGIIRSNGHG